MSILIVDDDPFICRQLEEFYGYTHATMYPDLAGFADFVRQRPLPRPWPARRRAR